MEDLVFYSLCTLIIGSALFILFTKNVMYAAFALLLTFTGVAGIYVFAVADVVAVTQLMVYVGGVLILLIFGVMFTSKLRGEKILTTHQHTWVGALLGISLFILLAFLIINVNFEKLNWIANASHAKAKSSLEAVGVQLMTNQALALEAVGVLLLLALIGTALIAGKK
jgi:NADH:ubiquinone oxidoreductase subunit 6 (subunit J)